jgi:hypothetical protein
MRSPGLVRLAPVAAALVVVPACVSLSGLTGGSGEPDAEARPDAGHPADGRAHLDAGRDARRDTSHHADARLDGHTRGDAGDAAAPLFYPSGVVTRADLAVAGTYPVQLASASTFDTDTGAITYVRDAGTGVISGIGFRVEGGVGIFTFASLQIESPGTTFSGKNAVALVSATTAVLEGPFDLQGTCMNGAPGPGGGAGGVPVSVAAMGPGAGFWGASHGGGGGGGGGYGAAGGVGGVPGGAAYGSAALAPLLGGSGGGGGLDGPTSATGGGGGGAIQIVAATSVDIGGQINAGGCGGGGGSYNLGTNGGGGGSGGAILVESPSVLIETSGVLAANGGGGGGSSPTSTTAPAGANATASATAAPGGGLSGPGQGNGGAGSSFAGGSGNAGENPAGGGGAVGRIRINSATGHANIRGTVSPSLTTDAAAPAATEGLIDVH